MKTKVLAITLFIVLVMITGCKKQDSSSAILSLNDEEVAKEEYMMLIKEHCNDVYMQYTTEEVNSEEFWETEINGNLPYVQLSEIILEELKYNYSLKQLAVELEVENKYDYYDLMKRMENENDERAEQIEQDEVIYGLSDFDESSYYKYWYSNLETRVTNEWIKKEANVTEKDCEEYYDDHKVEDYSYDVGVSILYVEIPYETEQDAMFVKRVLEQTEDVAEISELFPEIYIEELDLNSINTQEGTSGIYANRWRIASSLKKGEVYGPYEDYMGSCIIKCIDRTEKGFIDFDIVKSQIERYLQVEQADLYIENMKETMDVEMNEDKIKEVILETVKY